MRERSEQRTEDTWDLSALSRNREAWEKDMKRLSKQFRKARSFKGKLSESPEALLSAFEYLKTTSMEAERLGSWAQLMYEADSSDAAKQHALALFSAEAARFSEDISWFTPELIAMDRSLVLSWLKRKEFAEYRVWIRKELRAAKHTLGEKEERLLSLFSPLSGSAQKAFMDLNNIELDFGSVRGEKQTLSNYVINVRSSDENVRKEAYGNLLKAYDDHKNTIADLYAASVNEDVFISKARGFKSSLAAALFPDNIPEDVYTSLISAVHDAFPVLHQYYDVRAKVLGKEKLNHYDVYVPLVSGYKAKRSYDEAVRIISEAVAVLGDEYRSVLTEGLTSARWVDRYENKGKRSGAFSAGGYTGNPYILTNYEEEAIDSVFTLIHEGGHSMHSWYSVRNNPYMSYNYSIFEAETASTFNENLLTHYLLDNSASKEEEAYIIAKNLDDIVATLFRQTMFAEYELIIHREAEAHRPVTLQVMRDTYRSLLEAYFGPGMVFEETSDLEALRIPHFYRAFYCYKYATGISASIALSEGVLSGGEKERDAYLSFLKSGGSDYPIPALRKAGVDMSTPEPVKKAAEHFASLLERFRTLQGI